MESPARCHIVRQGECSSSIAARYGRPSPNDIYDDSGNRELREQRSACAVLQPGDVVRVPAHVRETFTLCPGSEKRLTVCLPRTRVRVRFERDGQPMCNEPYVLECDGQRTEGTTDGDGVVDERVPPHAVEARIRFTARCEVYPVRLGYLDPEASDTGISSRLRNLGYSCGDASGGREAMDGAVRRFRQDCGMRDEGGVDSEFVQELTRRHGS